MPTLLWWAVGALILIVVIFAVARVITSRRVRDEVIVRTHSSPVGDNVQFTIYRPRVVMPDHWYTLLAFAHLAAKRSEAPADEPDPVEEVRRQAVRVLGERQARDYQVMTQDAPQPVPREETLTFVPDIPGVEFNPPLRSFRWTESVHREEFRFRAGPDLVGQVARGRLSVFLGDILLAEVSLAIPVDQRAEPPEQDAPTETEHARRYRKIFASYSHRDLHVVEQIERLALALGDEYLRDWTNLRAGEVWDERLMQMIEEADVFQLFWSRHAMESPYVHREYEHALSLNRPNFVRPTYWEDPLPSDPARNLPPETLLRLHFQRIGPFLRSTLDRPWPLDGELHIPPSSPSPQYSPPSMAQPIRDKVFFSYSHRDQEWLAQLQTMMKPLVRSGAVLPWADTMIRTGADWREHIQTALTTAKVGVMLVSSNFLASDFIAEVELPALLTAAADEGLQVCWILVSACLHETSGLSRFQAAHDISRPLDSLTRQS